MGPDLVLRARLAMVRGSLLTVRRVLADLERVRDLGSDGATAADLTELVEQIDWAVSAMRDAKGKPDCSDRAEAIARNLEDFLADRRKRVTSTRPRLVLQETDVDNDIGDEVQDRLNELRDIEQLLTETETGNGDQLSQAWLRYASWSATCLKVFRDYVDLVRGVLLRDSGLDNDLCRIADKLVQAKWKDYKWESFTIPASEDHGDVSSLRLVRMGFPEWSIWSLPLAMYEIGHLFAEINPKVRPLVDAARQRCMDAATVSLANRQDVTPEERDQRIARAGDEGATRCELWIADAYATARLGPAYVWATVLFRADPASADDSNRVSLMLETLRLAEEAERDRPGSDDFKNERDRLRDEWSAARTQVTGSGDAVDPDAQMTKIAEDVRSRITVAFGPVDWETAMTIVDQLEDQQFEPAAIAAGELRNLQHVLNAGWKARIRLADERFEATDDLSPESLAEARAGFAKQKLETAHRLADRTREVCIAIIDGTASAEPQTSSPSVTGAPRLRPGEPSIDKTRSLPTGTG